MPRLSLTKILAYSCGALATGMFLAFNAFTLPYVIPDSALALTRGLPLLAPLVGIWSDRRGRRASIFLPTLMIAALLLLVSGFLAADPGFYFVAVLAMFGALLGYQIGSVPYTALLADITATQERGVVSGAAHAFGFLGQLTLVVGAFLLFGISPLWVFAFVAGALLLGFGIVAQGVPESRRGATRGAHDYNFNRYLLALFRAHPDALKLVAARFFYALGFGAILAFLPAFLATQIGLSGWSQIIALAPPNFYASLAKIDPRGLSQATAIVLLVATGIAAFPFGWLGDRIGKPKIFAAGLGVCALGALLIAWADNVPLVLGYLFAFGIGNAALTVLFFPWLSDLVSSDRYAEFAGLGAFGEGAALLLAFPLAGALVSANFFEMQYRAVFVMAAVVVLFALIMVLFVRNIGHSGNTPNQNIPGGKDA